MSQVYEIRLKKEFEFLQRLQRHPNTRNVINIKYKNRVGGGDFKSVLESPTGPLFPNKFKITYTFPIMYVGRGQVKTNWSYSFYLDVPESILMDANKTVGNEFEIEGGCFPDGMVPFNGHVSPNWVCIGALWQVANQGFGIWYFIISVGALLNQEKSEMDPNDTVHLNGDAWDYWMNDRQMAPNNDIKWPYNLDTIGVIKPQDNKPASGTGIKITPKKKSESSEEKPSSSMKITKK